CEPGFFGVDCASNCSRKCVDACDLYTGKCVDCARGFAGTHCQDCALHFYGNNCSRKCSPHCIDICNVNTGECTCKTGFYGSMCNECSAGRFGPNCTKHCPTGCKDHLCHVETGQCTSCYGRHIGPLCDDCPDKYYGYMCKYECSTQCMNESCDSLTGTCAKCLNNFDGPQCLIGNRFPLPLISSRPPRHHISSNNIVRIINNGCKKNSSRIGVLHSRVIKSCERGWFGERCMFKCQCLKSLICGRRGECPNNGLCSPGYFGPGCQYC
ncbi:unnamed protein product, partial [Candidula unifasciata]